MWKRLRFDQLKRREFITVLGSAAVTCLNKQNVFGRPKRFRVVRGDKSAASLSVQPSSESG